MSLVRLFVLVALVRLGQAVPAAFWHTRCPANGQPNVTGLFAIGQGPGGGAIGQFTQNQVFEEVVGLFLAELIDHQLLKLAQTHLGALLGARGLINREECIEFVQFDISKLKTRRNGVWDALNYS